MKREDLEIRGQALAYGIRVCELEAENEKLKKRIQAEECRLLERMLEWREINLGEQCDKCVGSGVIGYSSASMWRGGISGSTITTGVCDSCWGSGNKKKPGANLRAIEAQVSRLRAALERCVKWIEQRHEMPGYSEVLLLAKEALKR